MAPQNRSHQAETSIPIKKLAVATDRPTHVLGVHFFNPVPVLALVELVPSLLTDPATTERARAFVQDDLGKQSARLLYLRLLGRDRARHRGQFNRRTHGGARLLWAHGR